MTRRLNPVVKTHLYKVAANHCTTLKSGIIESSIYIGNNLITRYAKFGRLANAHQLFDEMPHRDSVSWNTLIAGYVNSGCFELGWGLFNDMRRRGFDVDGYSFGSLMKGIASNGDVVGGEQLHSVVVKTGWSSDVYTGSSLLDMYAKCGRVDEGYLVFQVMPDRTPVSWNAMIAGFVEREDFWFAFQLFGQMEEKGVEIHDGTVAPLLTLVCIPENFKLATQLHSKIIKHGLCANNIVCNALLSSYSACGSLKDAEKVFYGAVDVHDSITWNCMLGAYLTHKKERLAIELFFDMQECGFEPDIYTYASVVSACYEEAFHVHGRCFHCLIIKRGLDESIAISNALIALYQKSGVNYMVDVLRLFESIDDKDSVSWNSVLTAFEKFGMSEDAVKFFAEMRSENVMIDHYSFSSTIRSCAELAALQLGRQIHALSLKYGLESNEHVAGSLITMYSKCGLLDDARRAFEDTPKDSPITWNFIIFGYAQHGLGKIAIELFHEMTVSKAQTDHVTFVAVLTACSHMGWVEEGRHILKTMESEYGVPLRMEHYSCGIDLFGRAGLLDEAKALLKSMPFEPDVSVLKTFLGACRSCGDVELAKQVANELLERAPEDHVSYVILSDMYGRLKRWDEKATLTRLMRERGIRKVPGWSWIELNNVSHAFNAEDSSHPNAKEIYDTLDGLMEEIRMLKTSNPEVSSQEWAVLDGCCS